MGELTEAANWVALTINLAKTKIMKLQNIEITKSHSAEKVNHTMYML